VFVGDYLHKIRTLPLDEVLRRGSSMIRRRSESKLRKWRAEFCATYSAREDLLIEESFLLPGNFSYKEDASQTLMLAPLYLEHKFDLLGSGWRNVRYGMKALGVEGNVYPSENVIAIDSEGEWLSSRLSRTNLSYAKKIWKLVDEGYEPIPWQMDFKSGHTWSAKTWYTEIVYGNLLGVDIKVPWELSRMQHLPMLAHAYRIAAIEERENYAHEFRNEILDFIAQNPPRFGVNWRCTMDVGIRVANWLVAYDLFKVGGAAFDDDFEGVLASSVYDHGKHIIANLEYSPHLRSNHYLSDIAGLLFVALHLPQMPETDAWLAFALQELVAEMAAEFHEDGSNFEGSTSYHRLSTEIMLYSALFAVQMNEQRRTGLKHYDVPLHRAEPKLKSPQEQEFDPARKELFPAWFWQRLANALQFTKTLLRDDGEIPQIGDNDSGRFLKLCPAFVRMTAVEAVQRYENLAGISHRDDELYYDENILDHTHLARLYDVVFSNERKTPPDFETKLAAHMAQGLSLPAAERRELDAEKEDFAACVASLPISGLDMQEYHFAAQNRITEYLQCFSYPGMGVYIFKSPHLYMTVRCGEVGQKGNGGHAHNDQLSITLRIDGEDLIRDPGTYLYTPLPKERNRFRSTQAHFTIQKDAAEQNPFYPDRGGLFSLQEEKTFAKVLCLTRTGVVMEHHGFGDTVYRVIEILDHELRVRDYGQRITRSCQDMPFSNGYGKLLRRG
jgi:hypothetical protein